MLRASLRASAVAVVILSALGGCALLGDDTEEITSQRNPSEAGLTDDTAPPEAAFDPSLSFTDREGREVNHSQDRYRFDVGAFANDAEREAANVLYPSHAAHLAAHPGAIPSVQTIGTYTKQLDDTIYAGVERALQAGIAPTLEPKRSILSGALEHLLANRSAAADQAAVYVAAGIRLGGGVAKVPADLEAAVARQIADFAALPARSKPIGFYTWSDELRAIWLQDRYLQKELQPQESCALSAAIAADPTREARYEALVALYGKLTNPVKSSLVGSCETGKGAAFVATSQTAEVALFEKLYPLGVPENANMMQDLVDAIREGRLDLTPKEADGWYQHQQFALETLLVTDKSEERSKIGFTGRYKKRLQEAFETMLVQHRETHVKQTDMVLTSAAPPPKYPEFRAEPLATVYVRHARSYVFLEKALEKIYGAELLDGANAVDASGVAKDSLRQRIQRARDLFFGLYIVSSLDIGMKPKLEALGDPTRETWDTLASQADTWLKDIGKDALATSDVRVIVPIASVGAHRMKYWAVIGVRTTLAAYSYIHGSDMTAPASPDEQARIALPTEQFIEVTSSDVPLTRDELRALCDANVTADAIKAAIEQR